MHRTLLLWVSCCCLLWLAACGESATESRLLSPTPAPPTPVPTVLSAVMPTAVMTATVAPTTTNPILPQVDAMLNQLVEANQFSGSVLIAQAGQVLVSKGYGLADQAQNLPNTPQTKFRLGSLTKQFTAVAILMLQAQGALDVQDPICNYLPDCPPAWQTITIHHLLTHTAGLPNFTDFPDYEASKQLPTTPEQTISRFQDKPLDFEPGEGWNYSNSGYIVLGSIIEQASGQPYADFLQTHIFTPLGMTSTGYEDDASQLAIGYANGATVADVIDMSIPFAAGALYSTVEDLYLWDQALATEKLLPQALLDAMFTPWAAIPESNGLHYGYGWLVGEQFGHQVVGHNGSIEGFAASFMRFPNEQVVIIALSNLQATNPNAISQQLAQIVFEEK